MTANENDLEEKEIDDTAVVHDKTNIESIEKPDSAKKQHIHSALFTRLFSTKKRSFFSILLILVIICIVLFSIPVTRYGLVGLVVSRDVTVVVVDKSSKRPVSDARVLVNNVSTTTNKEGRAILKSVPVSQTKIHIEKKYYASSDDSYIVPIFSKPKTSTINLVATGRQVSIRIINKISGDPMKSVKISASGTSSETGNDGTASIILPANKNIQAGTLTKSGYVTAKVDINTISSSETANTFTLTPTGSIYYLSNITGSTDVMKSNLDGSQSSVVLKGTGNESKNQTTLLSTTDWQYMALQAKRSDDGQDRIYVIDDKTNTLKLVDQGASSFQLIGWSGHNLFYSVNRVVANYWDDKAQAIKSYNAETGALTEIDTTTGTGNSLTGYQFQVLSNFYIIDAKLFYSKTWAYSYSYGNFDQSLVNAVMVSDTSGNKKEVKTFSAINTSIYTSLYEPSGIYIRVNQNNTDVFYEYEDNAIKTINTTLDKFNTPYPTYLFSPSGEKTFWYETRNAKNTLFVGDDDAEIPKQVATLSDYVPFGWYGDDYIVLSKDGVLYITSSSKAITAAYPPIKIASYQPTTNSYRGYGSGYGGQ